MRCAGNACSVRGCCRSNGEQSGLCPQTLIPCDLDQLLEIAQRLEDEYGDGELERYLNAVGVTGIEGDLKNPIFAADGPKPRIVCFGMPSTTSSRS